MNQRTQKRNKLVKSEKIPDWVKELKEENRLSDFATTYQLGETVWVAHDLGDADHRPRMYIKSKKVRLVSPKLLTPVQELMGDTPVAFLPGKGLKEVMVLDIKGMGDVESMQGELMETRSMYKITKAMLACLIGSGVTLDASVVESFIKAGAEIDIKIDGDEVRIEPVITSTEQSGDDSR